MCIGSEYKLVNLSSLQIYIFDKIQEKVFTFLELFAILNHEVLWM